MVSKSPKPIGQCEGCMLNLKTRCAAFEHPFLKWQHGDCEGYNDPELIKKYLDGTIGDGAHARKKERCEKGKISHTIAHKNGFHPLRGASH